MYHEFVVNFTIVVVHAPTFHTSLIQWQLVLPHWNLITCKPWSIGSSTFGWI